MKKIIILSTFLLVSFVCFSQVTSTSETGLFSEKVVGLTNGKKILEEKTTRVKEKAVRAKEEEDKKVARAKEKEDKRAARAKEKEDKKAARAKEEEDKRAANAKEKKDREDKLLLEEEKVAKTNEDIKDELLEDKEAAKAKDKKAARVKEKEDKKAARAKEKEDKEAARAKEKKDREDKLLLKEEKVAKTNEDIKDKLLEDKKAAKAKKKEDKKAARIKEKEDKEAAKAKKEEDKRAAEENEKEYRLEESNTAERIRNKEYRKSKKTKNKKNRSLEDHIYSFVEHIVPIYPFDLDPIVKGFVRDSISGVPIAEAKVIIYDNKNEKFKTVTTDDKGEYTVSLVPLKDYTFVFEKRGFTREKVKVGGMRIQGEQKLYSVLFNNLTVIVDHELVILHEGDDLSKMLKLKPVYFDYGLVSIRKSSKQELDKVVELLKRHTNISIDVRSYTDSKGVEKNNLQLSEKRAKSIMDYIVNDGNIDQNRITGRGYGESHLLNRCKRGVRCTEAEHQENRRSEFIVIIKE